MPPQTPGALDKKIGGGKVGHHQIEIEVQALLHHLGRHQRPVARGTASRLGVKRRSPSVGMNR